MLDYSALKRYKKVFKLRGKLNITKTQLLGVIKEHASHQLILLGNSRNNALLGPSTSEVEGGIWIGDDIVAKFITYVKKERLAGPKLDKYSDLDDY